MTAPRILLADADVPTRVGFRAALRRAGFEVVAEADDVDAAVAAAELAALSHASRGSFLVCDWSR